VVGGWICGDVLTALPAFSFWRRKRNSRKIGEKPMSGLGIRRADLKFGHYIRGASGLKA
jgi:hypothetical protein